MDPFEIWERWGHITGLGYCDEGTTPFTVLAIKVFVMELAPLGGWVDMAEVTRAAYADQAILFERGRAERPPR